MLYVEMDTKQNPASMRLPVNQSGSFESDRILKSGRVLKRTKRTKSWKPACLVLRPNLLSIYKDQEEKHLRHQIILSDITAIALRSDRKGKDEHPGVFGIFSPSRNYHLEADTEAEARSWVQLIKVESHLDLVEVNSEHTGSPPQRSVMRNRFQALDDIVEPVDELTSPSLTTHQNTLLVIPSPTRGSTTANPIRRPSDYDMSSNEAGSYSDFSEGAVFGSSRDIALGSPSHTTPISPHQNSAQQITVPIRNASPSRIKRVPFYKLQTSSDDGERVVWHGHLQCRKSQDYVRQWKNYWVVLRYKSLTLYKDEEEYAALLIIPLSTVIDVVETDPLGKNKKHCMQIITDDRSYRFCAKDEDGLSNWIGRIKSVLAKRRDTKPA